MIRKREYQVQIDGGAEWENTKHARRAFFPSRAHEWRGGPRGPPRPRHHADPRALFGRLGWADQRRADRLGHPVAETTARAVAAALLAATACAPYRCGAAAPGPPLHR